MKTYPKRSLAVLTDIFLKEDILKECAAKIQFSDNGELVWQSDKKTFPRPKRTVYSYKFVPGYLEIEYVKNNMHVKKYRSVKGYAVQLDHYPDAHAYLKDTFSDKGKAIRRSLRRLETCFGITYTMYHGAIEKERFQYLCDILKGMIIERFRQRKEKSHNLAFWDDLLEKGYELIIEKKASLFVIYHRSKPIEISFNFNYTDILFSYISSYDLDYHKFSLGQIEIFKQLEWCITNGYRYFEMGWGDLHYKRRWSNIIYTFEHHLAFPKNSIFGYLSAVLEGNKTKLLAFLLEKKVNVHYKKLKRMFFRNEDIALNPQSIESGEVISGSFAGQHVPIPYPSKDTQFLNSSVYSFLYVSQEKYTNIKVFQLSENQYIIQGSKCYQMVALYGLR